MMNNQALQKVISQVHRRFPEFAGSKPKVQQRKSTQQKPNSTTPTYLLTFQSKGKAVSSKGVKTIPRSVRVVANQSGKILKISTSR